MTPDTEVTPIRYVDSRKQVLTKDGKIIVTLWFEGPVQTPFDAMTLLADWFCREVATMGFDPEVIIQRVNRMRLESESADA